jgi:alkylation response protein AidB-like acyl-CoA dehydrogenase
VTATTDIEDLDNFTRRARKWLAANMPRIVSSGDGATMHSRTLSDEEELARINRCRELQRILFDGGLAGIGVPREYGGQGLTYVHQAALNQEIVGYDYPGEIQVPTFTPCMAVLLEFGTEEQKRRHVPAILKGEEFWMQFLSEPSGGSDAAGALTTAKQDGEEWIVNGSKIWTTGAWWADWALCLTRTNWDAPKHRGLTVFILPIHQPGIDIHRIEMLNGSREFCQEFLTDVRVPDSDRIGDIDEGWTVGTRWMYHERTVRGGSPYVTRPGGRTTWRGPNGGAPALIRRLRDSGRLDSDRNKELIGEVHALETVGYALTDHIARRIREGQITDQAAAVSRLYNGTQSARANTLAFEVAAASGVAWTDSDAALGEAGIDFLMRQAACIGGGTSEMSRNVISERVLGMPRERRLDRDVAFRDVPRGPDHRTMPNH